MLLKIDIASNKNHQRVIFLRLCFNALDCSIYKQTFLKELYERNTAKLFTVAQSHYNSQIEVINRSLKANR